MLPWFLTDSERLTKERVGVEDLARSAKWLVGADWGIAGELYFDAIIRAHNHDYEVRLSFPQLFPDTPIVVRMRNTQRRISTHQYGGANGVLCLEWGPDTWHRDVTAVQMLESAHRLFETENPLGEEQPTIPVVAPSRHAVTIGQEFRSEWARWYASSSLVEFIAAQPQQSTGDLQYSLRETGGAWVALVHEATPQAGDPWKDPQIPPVLGADLHAGTWLKTTLLADKIRQPKTQAELQAVLANAGCFRADAFNKPLPGFLVVDQIRAMRLFIVLRDETVFECRRIESEQFQTGTRAPEVNRLTGKTIGIVGVGSVGSKMATSLTRMGASKLLLVDHDIFLPENLHRHSLNWEAVGYHKADAMSASLRLINPGITVETSRHHITGQESNAIVNGTLNKLAECDLIIDATADSKVFNLLAAVARTSKRPMVWMEVYGGGIGGMVARSRPSLDPTPQDMRGAFQQYCIENPFPAALQKTSDYATETPDGKVLTASDSDVGIIAHHAARLVPDCFVPAEQAKFPYSMYLIGLTQAWVFEAPFATIPISMSGRSTAGWDADSTKEYSQDNINFLSALIEKQTNAIANSTGNQNPTC